MQAYSKILMSPQPEKTIRECAATIYPRECCGFLLGHHLDHETRVLSALPVQNDTVSDASMHYQITAQSYMEAERSAEQAGMSILGVYHSHPGQAAVPSPTDTKNALPDFLYLIVSVNDKGTGDLTCWLLNDDLTFSQQQLNHN